MVRTAIESLYVGVCTITNSQKVFNYVTKRVTFEDVVICENEPCRLSYSSISTADYDKKTSAVEQIIKLFVRPELEVAAGSKITITQNGRTVTYKASGQPAVYTNHQEILLRLDDRA